MGGRPAVSFEPPRILGWFTRKGTELHLRIACTLLLALPLFACSSAEDRAAKARIFSPEDPPKVLLAAAEKLEPGKAAKDSKVLDRILSISADEARARIGPHVQSTTVEFRWVRDAEDDDGSDREVKLAEDRYVALGAANDFHVRIENDERQGMEWVKIDGVSYARSRYARFRERRRDRGSSEHVVASAYATLEAFNELVHGGMVLTPAGEETFEGRRAIKYELSLGPLRKIETSKALPPVEYPKGGPDLDTALRLAALEEGRPSAVTGTLTLDQETGVPLAADLRATVKVPAGTIALQAPTEAKGTDGPSEDESPADTDERAADGAPSGTAAAEQDEAAAEVAEKPSATGTSEVERLRHGAELELSVRLLLSGIGKDPGLRIPEHIEDAPRPPGVVATLRAYGLEEQKAPAETPSEPEDEE